MAKTTASAMGRTGISARRSGRTWEERTMQMAEGGDERRDGNLLGRRPEWRFTISLPISSWRLMFLDLHGGVVHQNAHGQGQPSQRHQVDGSRLVPTGRSASIGSKEVWKWQ